jgi:hypothetical protein
MGLLMQIKPSTPYAGHISATYTISSCDPSQYMQWMSMMTCPPSERQNRETASLASFLKPPSHTTQSKPTHKQTLPTYYPSLWERNSPRCTFPKSTTLSILRHLVCHLPALLTLLMAFLSLPLVCCFAVGLDGWLLDCVASTSPTLPPLRSSRSSSTRRYVSRPLCASDRRRSPPISPFSLSLLTSELSVSCLSFCRSSRSTRPTRPSLSLRSSTVRFFHLIFPLPLLSGPLRHCDHTKDPMRPTHLRQHLHFPFQPNQPNSSIE